MKKSAKKVFAISLLTALSFSNLNAAFAILENNAKTKVKKENKQAKKEVLKGQSVLNYINFDWWKELNDPYLEKYITTAIEKNNDIKIAALKLEQAKINVTATRASQLPSLSIGATPMLNKKPGVTNTTGTFAMPIMAQYELDLFGKNWDKTKSSKKLLESTRFQTQSADISIVAMVATIYYNIVKLDKIIELQEQLTSDREEIYNLMKISNNEGIVSTQDLIAAEKSFVLAQNDLLDYKKTRANALNALAVLIGDSPENVKEYQRISIDKLALVSVPNEIASDIIFSRPDYKAKELELEASGIDVRVAKKEFLPTINILGLVTFLATSTVSSFDWKNAFSILGLSGDMPLFTGGKKIANFKLNKNKYEQILQEYQKTGLTSIQEVNDSLYNLKTDNEKFANNTKALNIQKQDFKYTTYKYDKGVISKLDLLQQKEALLYMEIMEAQSKMDCYIDKISLYKATGGRPE